jgi:hypothetical protein
MVMAGQQQADSWKKWVEISNKPLFNSYKKQKNIEKNKL